MHSIQRNSSLAVAVVAALGFANLASAQSIVITNANNHEIPLASGSSVQIDVNGNLLAQCALTNGTCTQLSNGGPNQGAPVASLSRNDGDTSLTAGESIRLTWGSTAGTVCNATSAGPAGTSWTGPRAVANASGENVVLSAAGDYTFSLQCFNTSGGSSLVATAATVAPNDSPPPAGCSLQSSDPLFQPASLAAVTKEWDLAFKSPNSTQLPVYPNSPGAPVPVGASKGSYTAIRFTARANTTVDMTWDTAQAQLGYSNPRPADSMFISISPCAGDLRAPNSASGDPWLQGGCRISAGAGSMFYTTLTNYQSSDFLCRLEAGQVYYINVSPIEPNDGLTPGEHTCSNTAANSATGCDVQMRHSGS